MGAVMHRVCEMGGSLGSPPPAPPPPNPLHVGHTTPLSDATVPGAWSILISLVVMETYKYSSSSLGRSLPPVSMPLEGT